ncbi:transglutaminase family protein [Isoptericola variabilis]|uniref:Transglutaminase domain-containing protein n=1 Tax=Isoptericola variabilis (strain 225) TaxID=743718 RepID=F6FVB5_ISOV2|nr:transglutaminase-like domain-containing protein [Isoptericola variabilis]AEG43388.1 transglutaminase domain-containing protein [Isoptericola variabilis 225]TWH34557.1 Transglutaminase-like enzymes, putative cysteine proteases [Isoptericola variabilis J7]
MTDDRTSARPGADTGTTGGTRGTSRTSLRAGTTRGRGRGDDRPRVTGLGGLVDGAVLAALLVAVALGFGPAWGDRGYLVPALGGAAVGLAVAWAGAWRRWSVLPVAAATVLAYFLLGGALALRHTVVAGVVPTPRTLHELAVGAVQGWKRFVTTVPPLSSFPDLAVVPYLLLLLVAVLAGTIAWRATHAAWALLPVVAGLGTVALLGTILAAAPLVQGLVVAVVGVLWASWRTAETRMAANRLLSEASRSATRRLRAQRLRGGVAMLAVGGVAAVLLAPPLVAGERTVLREMVTPPLDLHRYTSPLVGFRQYTRDLAETELFTVTGLPEGARVRLATLDAYAGTVYDVSSGGAAGVFNRAGEVIDTVATGTRTTVEVAVTGYSGVWLPDVGQLAGIRFTGERAAELASSTYYNATSGTAVVTAGVRPGDTYELSAVVSPPPAEDALASARILDVDLPSPRDVPDAAPAKAQQFAADATDAFERLVNIRDTLVATGVYSSGLDNQPPSRPGHSAARIDELLAQDEMVGDDEQFAVTLALLAQQAGIPARVVMGFYPDEGAWEAGEPYVATGADVHAWVEVPFEGYGWVPFDVVPDEDNKVEPLPRNRQVPKPPVLEDPEAPEEPPQAEAGDVEDEEKDEQDAAGVDWRRVLTVVVSVAVPLALLVLPFLLVLGLKARRRRRRRTAPVVADRVSGGWREVVDAATDLGAGVPRGATRREGARLLAEQLPAAAAPTTTTLAHRADATVFGAVEPTEAEVEQFWAEVDRLVGELHGGVPWRRRVAARLSLRSLRGADAPPLHVAAGRVVAGVVAGAGRRAAGPWRRVQERTARAARRRARTRDREGR